MRQLLEIVTLSATNLPNVRRLPKGKTRAMVVVEGPLTEPFRTEADEKGGLNPSWETFTVSLEAVGELKITVYLKRKVRKNKPIATAQVPLRDFSSPGGDSHEYSLRIVNVPAGRGSEQQVPKLQISARLLGGRQNSPAILKEYSGGIKDTVEEIASQDDGDTSDESE